MIAEKAATHINRLNPLAPLYTALHAKSEKTQAQTQAQLVSVSGD